MQYGTMERTDRPNRTWRRAAVGLLAVMAVVVSGCGDSDDASGDGTDAPSAVSDSTSGVDADAITVSELLDREAEQRPGDNVLVVAVLFDDGDGMRMCEALAESFPPQCPGRSIDIRNPDAVDVEWSEEAGIRWTDRAIVLLGWVEDGEFVVT